MKKTIGSMLILAVVIGGLLSGCGTNSSTTSSESKSKVLHVGTNATYVPFESVSDEGDKNGKKEYQGFDIDLAKEIGKRLGMEVEIHNIPFDGLIPALMTKEIDVIASGMVITPEREQKISFVPYYDSGLGILVKDSIADVQKLSDLKGKKVAVQMGTTGSVAAHSVEGIGSIKEFDHNAEALLELKQGAADAVITAIPVAKHFLKTTKDSGAKLVVEPISKQTMGLGLSKENKELTEKIKAALEEIKADGTYDKLAKKWIE